MQHEPGLGNNTWLITQKEKTQLAYELPLCCSWRYVAESIERNNKLNTHNYVSVEITQHHMHLFFCWSAEGFRRHLRSTSDTELNGKQWDIVHIWGTHEFRRPVMFSVTSPRWKRLLNTKPNTKSKARTRCDWDFGLGTDFAAASQATLSRRMLIQLLN